MQSTLRRLYKPGSATPLGEEIIKLQQVVLPYHIAAIASSIRDGPLRELDYAYAKLGKSDVKVLVVWGTADTVVPYSLATQVLTQIPRAKLITAAGAGHDLLVTHAEEVGAALTDSLRWKQGSAVLPLPAPTPISGPGFCFTSLSGDECVLACAL